MNITINEQEGKLVAVLEGDLDNVASTQVIDCTDLNYISSSGLRILLNIYKHTRTNGHNAILKGLKDDVKEVFQISGFLQLFITE